MSIQQMPNKWFGFALLVHYTICPSFIKLKKGLFGYLQVVNHLASLINSPFWKNTETETVQTELTKKLSVSATAWPK